MKVTSKATLSFAVVTLTVVLVAAADVSRPSAAGESSGGGGGCYSIRTAIFNAHVVWAMVFLAVVVWLGVPIVCCVVGSLRRERERVCTCVCTYHACGLLETITEFRGLLRRQPRILGRTKN